MTSHMKNDPIVSVVVAVHNMKEHIRQCIDSVLNQSLQELELVLVDDVSTDGTADILREYAEKDGRIMLVWQPENGGAQLARNAGIAVSRGKYVTTLDHDDFLDKDALTEALASASGKSGFCRTVPSSSIRRRTLSVSSAAKRHTEEASVGRALPAG